MKAVQPDRVEPAWSVRAPWCRCGHTSHPHPRRATPGQQTRERPSALPCGPACSWPARPPHCQGRSQRGPHRSTRGAGHHPPGPDRLGIEGGFPRSSSRLGRGTLCRRLGGQLPSIYDEASLSLKCFLLWMCFLDACCYSQSMNVDLN
uniref:Uncharacterized protein n=1 Tax=Rousettus aegyptiacus TaxID=9407 RepID=A0A7J8F1L5_ROUAE|nr:hypothetical protein HJG63_012449 [Rousettus aegyptiacus]